LDSDYSFFSAETIITLLFLKKLANICAKIFAPKYLRQNICAKIAKKFFSQQQN
jgi:hypothetical protein